MTAQMLRLFRLIATMDATAPLPFAGRQKPYLGLSIAPRVALGAESVEVSRTREFWAFPARGGRPRLRQEGSPNSVFTMLA